MWASADTLDGEGGASANFAAAFLCGKLIKKSRQVICGICGKCVRNSSRLSRDTL